MLNRSVSPFVIGCFREGQLRVSTKDLAENNHSYMLIEFLKPEQQKCHHCNNYDNDSCWRGIEKSVLSYIVGENIK